MRTRLEQRPSVAADAVPRRLVSRVHNYPEGNEQGSHRHAGAQLAGADRGTFTARTPQGTWRVPPRWAIWLPSDVEHELTSGEHLRLFSIYLEPEDAAELPAVPGIVRIPTLLTALIEESGKLPELYDEAGADGRLVATLIDELAHIEVHPLPVTVPDSEPLATLYGHYCQHPDSRKSLADWASELGTTRRTLTRMFQRDLGVDFRTWRIHLKLQAALEMLNREVQVGVISAELGYASASAFSASFRRYIGCSPTAFGPEAAAQGQTK